MKLLSIISILFLGSCATGVVVPTEGKQTYKSGGCSVEIYNSASYAEKFGKITEICTVSGSSAFSFDHSLKGAIKKNISKVCGCGAAKAYIAATSQENDMGLRGVTNITLVGFKY